MDIAAAKKRCEAATGGPWLVTDRNEAGDRYVGPAEEYVAIVVRDALARLMTDANAEFIAHARTDLPAALEALEEAKGLIAALRLQIWNEGNSTTELLLDRAREIEAKDRALEAAQKAAEVCGDACSVHAVLRGTKEGE